MKNIMNIESSSQKNVSSIKNIHMFFISAGIVIFLSIFFIFSSTPVLAACGDPGEASCDTTTTVDTGNPGAPSAVTDIYLREPMIPGKDKISGSSEAGALGILAEYISMVYQYVAALSSIIAVLVIMFAGFQMMVSGGQAEAKTQAKDMITKTLTGIAMLFLSGLFLYIINPNFYVFGGGTNTGAGAGVGESEQTETE